MLLIISIVVLLVAFYLYHRRQRRRAELRRTLRFDGESSLRLRISIVATDVQDIGYIATLLCDESNSYQVVVVSDFSQSEALLHAITHYFGLFRVSVITSEKLPKQALRAVFRSHRRLYAKLIVIDSAPSDSYTPLRVGTEMSSYDYILHLCYPRSLRNGAIEDLLLELAMRHEGSVEQIISGLGEGAKLVRREVIIATRKHRGRPKAGGIVRLDYNILE